MRSWATLCYPDHREVASIVWHILNVINSGVSYKNPKRCCKSSTNVRCIFWVGWRFWWFCDAFQIFTYEFMLSTASDDSWAFGHLWMFSSLVSPFGEFSLRSVDRLDRLRAAICVQRSLNQNYGPSSCLSSNAQSFNAQSTFYEMHIPCTSLNTIPHQASKAFQSMQTTVDIRPFLCQYSHHVTITGEHGTQDLEEYAAKKR